MTEASHRVWPAQGLCCNLEEMSDYEPIAAKNTGRGEDGKFLQCAPESVRKKDRESLVRTEQ